MPLADDMGLGKTLQVLFPSGDLGIGTEALGSLLLNGVAEPTSL